MTAQAIKFGANISVMSNSQGILVGFSSLGAHASVNHLHMHAYYLEREIMHKRQYPLPIYAVQHATRLSKHLWFMSTKDYFMPGFVLQLSDYSDNLDAFSKDAFKITNYLSLNEISHNLVIIKAGLLSSDCNEQPDQDCTTLRLVIWPRKSAYLTAPNKFDVAFAICEMAGHFMVTDLEKFEEINENILLDLCSRVRLDDSDMNLLIENITTVMDSL